MRVKLSIQYHTEREEICKKLIDILDLDENNSILLCDLEQDTERPTYLCRSKVVSGATSVCGLQRNSLPLDKEATQSQNTLS